MAIMGADEENIIGVYEYADIYVFIVNSTFIIDCNVLKCLHRNLHRLHILYYRKITVQIIVFGRP